MRDSRSSSSRRHLKFLSALSAAAWISLIGSCAPASSGVDQEAAQEASGVDQEAAQVARAAFDHRYKNCGESYYATQRSGRPDFVDPVQELKGPIRITVRSEPLSEADRLNGVEWRGRAELQYAAYRSYSSSGFGAPGFWGRWSSTPPSRDDPFSKVGGHWNGPNWSVWHPDNPVPASAIDCAAIPD